MRALSLSVRFSSIELLTQSPIHRPSELIKILVLIYDFEGESVTLIVKTTGGHREYDFAIHY